MSRNRTALAANIGVPLLDRNTPVVGWLGRLTANANVLTENLSDFGALTTYGLGLGWSPSPCFNVRADNTDEQDAPTVEQLGNPVIASPNSLIFDPERRETVAVTLLTGGNRALRPGRRHVSSLGVTAKPFSTADITINVDYVDTRTNNPIETFPVLTPVIEAAFPERLTRASDGNLADVDTTPINFASSEQRELRSEFSFSHALGTVPPGFEDGAARFDPGEADMRMTSPGHYDVTPKPGSMFEHNLETASSRIFFNIQHIWRLTDNLRVQPGGPLLNLLGGDALSATGGQSRNEVDVQTGIAKRGIGGSVTAAWRSGTRVTDLGTNGDLTFDSYTSIDLSLFANLGTYLNGRGPIWTKGLRASLTVVDLFDTRPQVHDSTGAVPLSYQAARLAPLGRTIEFSLRKLL